MRLFDNNRNEIAHRIKENTDSLAKLLDMELKRVRECKWQQEDLQNTHQKCATK